MNVSAERTRSLWMQTEVLPEADALQADLKADVLIVGSGMAGLSAAYELAQTGRKVIVVDRGRICGGMTARTTAHLAAICDDGISSLINLRGADTARLFHESQQAAIDRMEAIVKQHGIDCDFRRVEGILFPALDLSRDEAAKQLDKELEAAEKSGLVVARATGLPLQGLEGAATLHYPNQATFHPLKYLQALARIVLDKGGLILANSPVVKVDELKDGVRITTENMRTATADHAIVATNTPINNRVELHSKMAPYRTYAMTFALPRGALPDALFWDTADPYHYVRLNPGPQDVDHLIVGGEDHKSGEANDGARRFGALGEWIRRLVPQLGEEVHRWSGQVMNTIDHCGFIGRNPGSERVLVATGDSGQGITHGALAGMLLKDLVVAGSSPWQETYEPSRKPARAIVNYVRENVTALKNFAEYVLPGDIESIGQLQPGQGGVLNDGLRRLAVCRDVAGALHVHSAACTHLGCHVNWNATEQCWDCACHGSQFAPDGAVLNGPALSPLAVADIPQVRRRA
jgi:glycine/D-amino acid oxidase-like deaminating enzyme/nitrite reductase/ring-hydroxylating ferredoxin subunit